MNLDNILELVKQIPLFASLADTQQRVIADKSSIVEYKKDNTVYREGDSPNAFFCIISGRVVLYTKDRQGNKTIIEYLHRGKYFGIISLITGEPHSVTAEALNDTVLLRIDKSDFKTVISKVPQLSIDLMQTLSRRLKRKDIHQKTIFESTIISIYSSQAQAGKTVYAVNLALSLKKETRKEIMLIDVSYKGKLHRIPQRLGVKAQVNELDLSYAGDIAYSIKDYILSDVFGIDIACVSYDPVYGENIKAMISVLSLLVNDYHYIILDLPVGMDEAIFGILNQSDTIHIISSPQELDLKKTRRLIERLETEHNFSLQKIKVIVNDYKQTKLTHEEKARILRTPIYATLPQFNYPDAERIVLDEPAFGYSRAVRRISRQIGDCNIGLALGVGAAYGLTHIGVLKALEEERVPIDIIAGSSIGAFVAAFWASGLSADEIGRAFLREFKDTNIVRQLIDLTFPFTGFIKGRKLYRIIKRYLGKKTFYDVRLPLKIIACDIKKKRSIVIDKGLLADAVLASCAMPGVFRPVNFKEELLFDGGVLNPLPTEVLVKEGVKKIIAVNVTPSREDLLREYEKARASGYQPGENIIKRRGLFGLKWHFKDILKVNILDFIFGSIEIMQSEMAKKESQAADVILHPDTSGLNWLEFYKVRDFIRRGEEETLKNMDKILQLVRE